MVQRTIAVGVGGASGLRALAWAADEADGSQDRLVMVRVCPSCSPLARLVGEPPVLMLEQADRGFARAVTETGIPRDVQRRLRVIVGEPGTALADASTGADLMVISATGGDVAAQVVRHTHCPLVVVRPGPARPGDPFAGHVVVGVDGRDAGRAALDFAFGYAAAHRLPVAAVHVSARSDTDDAIRSPGPAAEAAARELLGAEVGPWELAHPRVRVRQAILHGEPADRLVRAAAGAALLVIGSERGGAAGHAGSLPRAVTARALCPVTVVPLEQA